MAQLLLVTILKSHDCAVYLDGKLIIASNLIHDPTETIDYSTELVKGVAESLSIALSIEINEAGILGGHNEWDWDSVKSVLIAKGVMFNGEPKTLNLIDHHFKWFEPVLTPEGMMYFPIKENNISGLFQCDLHEAAQTIEHSIWELEKGAIYRYALVKFSMSLVTWAGTPDLTLIQKYEDK